MNNILKENGLTHIKPRTQYKNDSVQEPPEKAFPKYVYLTRATEYKKTLPAFETDDQFELSIDTIKIPKSKKKHKKHKKKNKKQKIEYFEPVKKYKKKKNSKEKAQKLLEEISVPEKNNNGSIIADILEIKKFIHVEGNDIWVYMENMGCFKLLEKYEIGSAIMDLLQKNHGEYHGKITSREINEAITMIKMKSKLQGKPLSNMLNLPYILCQNGVVSLENLKLKDFSPDYEFTRTVNASFDNTAKGDAFEKYLDYATEGDTEKKKLLQEIVGYILSTYSNLRIAFMFIGPKRSGKSLILSIIRELIGAEHISSINIQDFESEYNRATILNAAANIVPEMPSTPIKKEISTFKALTSSLDSITGRKPYGMPQNKACNTKLLFASNEVPKLVGVSPESVEAFYDRIIVVPFMHRVSDEDRDPNLNVALMNERDYIFTWACKGMKRLIKNNYHFSDCKAAQEFKEYCWARQCPEQSFCEYHLKRTEDDIYESSKKIKDTFEDYCKEHHIKCSNKNAIINYLDYAWGYSGPCGKKRIDDSGHITTKGNPISVYQGIRLI